MAEAVAFCGSHIRSVQQVTQKILHPGRERADAAAEILGDRGSMMGIVEDRQIKSVRNKEAQTTPPRPGAASASMPAIATG